MRINTEYNNHKSNVNFGAKILATDATLEAFKYAKELLYSNNKEKFLYVSTRAARIACAGIRQSFLSLQFAEKRRAKRHAF